MVSKIWFASVAAWNYMYMLNVSRAGFLVIWTKEEIILEGSNAVSAE